MNTKELLLIQLQEELCEVHYNISKSLRFGLMDTNPKTNETNLDAIRRELTDVNAVLDELSQSENIILTPLDKHSNHYIQKRRDIIKWLEYAMNRGKI